MKENGTFVQLPCVIIPRTTIIFEIIHVRKASCCVRVRIFPFEESNSKEKEHEASNADSRSALAQVALEWIWSNCVYFWLTPVNISGFPNRKTCPKFAWRTKKLNRVVVWVKLINFTKITLYKQNSISNVKEVVVLAKTQCDTS